LFFGKNKKYFQKAEAATNESEQTRRPTW